MSIHLLFRIVTAFFVNAQFIAISEFSDACKTEKFWLFLQPLFGRVLELIIGQESVNGAAASNLETVLGRMSALTSDQTNAAGFSSFYCLLFFRREVVMMLSSVEMVITWCLVSSGCTKEQSKLFTARCYASAVLAIGLCPSVCLSVRHKSVFYRNGWTNRAGFWHVSFLPPVLHCAKRKFGYLQK